MATEIRVPDARRSPSPRPRSAAGSEEGRRCWSQADEPLLELETDKVTLEVPAPASGVRSPRATAKDGETVAPGALLGQIAQGGCRRARTARRRQGACRQAPAPTARRRPRRRRLRRPKAPAADAAVRRRRRARSPPTMRSSPAATVAGHRRATASVAEGRRAGRDRDGRSQPRRPRRSRRLSRPRRRPARLSPAADAAARGARGRMTRTAPDHRAPPQGRAEHRRHADDLQRGRHEPRHGAARRSYKDVFEKKHGSKLGFMGFFAKACVQALKDVPAANAEIDGTDLDLQELLSRRRRGRHRQGPRWCRSCATRDQQSHRRTSRRAIADFGTPRAATASSQIDEMQRRHLHHHQWRRLRLADVDADPATRRRSAHPRHAQDPGSPGGRSPARSTPAR